MLPFHDSGGHAFPRYENGKTKPLLALVKLFKMLDRNPDLLEEMIGGVYLPRFSFRNEEASSAAGCWKRGSSTYMKSGEFNERASEV